MINASALLAYESLYDALISFLISIALANKVFKGETGGKRVEYDLPVSHTSDKIIFLQGHGSL